MTDERWKQIRDELVNDESGRGRVDAVNAACKRIADLEREVDRLWLERDESRRLFLDHPDDRLWHAEDGTWWSRPGGPGTPLQAAGPPGVAEWAAACDTMHDTWRQQAIRTAKAAKAVERERDEARAAHEGLRAAVNADVDCLPACDANGHAENCPATTAAIWLERQRARIDELEAGAEQLRAALRLYFLKGHHDTCSHLLVETMDCDCGHAAAAPLLEGPLAVPAETPAYVGSIAECYDHERRAYEAREARESR